VNRSDEFKSLPDPSGAALNGCEKKGGVCCGTPLCGTPIGQQDLRHTPFATARLLYMFLSAPLHIWLRRQHYCRVEKGSQSPVQRIDKKHGFFINNSLQSNMLRLKLHMEIPWLSLAQTARTAVPECDESPC
jgi:hypothetical protein